MSKSESVLKNAFTEKILVSLLICITLFTGALGFFAFQSSASLSELQKTVTEMTRLQGLVLQYDEILTMSARMAASTGDQKWEHRYLQYEPQLNTTIKALIGYEPVLASQIDKANIKLVEMEKVAFDLVRQDKQADAARILFSSDYEKQKDIYSLGIQTLNENLNQRMQSQLESYQNQANLIKTVLTIFILFSVFGWVYVFNLNRRWTKQLQSVNENLDAQVKQQTIQLFSAAKMSALGETVSGLAHEINTPLTVILMRLDQMEEAISEGNFDPVGFLKSIDLTRRTTERISKIINGLRFFAREGRKDVSQAAAISELVEETLSFCTERFSKRGVDLRIVKNDAYYNLSIECRAVEISQVLLNLFNNAFDAIENLPEKWITVEAFDRGDNIEMHVTDSGSGIPKDIAAKIMQPFFTTKDVGKGTGLGLSISLGIVESHRGTFRIDDTCSHTKFVVVLPKKQNDQQINQQTATISKAV